VEKERCGKVIGKIGHAVLEPAKQKKRARKKSLREKILIYREKGRLPPEREGSAVFRPQERKKNLER